MIDPASDRFDAARVRRVEAELGERVRASGVAYVVDRWEVSFAPPVDRRGGEAFWLARDLVAVAAVAAGLAALAVPAGVVRDPPRPVPRPSETPVTAAPTPQDTGERRADALLSPLLDEEVAIKTAPELRPPAAARSSAPAAPARPQPTEPTRRGLYASNDPSPDFDCRPPFSFAEEKVCASPDLSDQNGALGRAFRRAQSAGAPASSLYARQDDWVRARDEAAYTAPWRLSGLYAQRIGELERAAGIAAAP